MTDINIVDMVLHIDNTLDTKVREAVENELRSINGVISVHMPDDRRHLVELAYNPAAVKSETIAHSIRELAGHVEMVGL